MSSKTVLIIYISVGQGHWKAALAIQDALRNKDPVLNIICLNFFEIWPGWEGEVITGLYRMLIRFAPGLWTSIYDHRRIKESLVLPMRLLSRILRRRSQLLMEKFAPEVVVCTQALPSILAADCKRSLNHDYLLVAVPTDFHVHGYWIDDEVDLYLLPSEESKKQVISDGVDSKCIQVTGIPVHPQFSQCIDPILLKKKYGLSPADPIVLLMGGGDISLKLFIQALDAWSGNFQIAVLAGRDLRQHTRLKHMQPRLSHNFQVYSFVDSVDEFMEIGDVIVTKPGGLTTAEALAKRLPLVLINPLPGQEEFNAEFLERNGVAIRATDEEGAASIVMDLLGNTDLRRNMIKSMENIRKPEAARMAAESIINYNLLRLLADKDNYSSAES